MSSEKEYAIDNHPEIVQLFIESYETEYNDYLRDSLDDGAALDTYLDDDGNKRFFDSDLRSEFVTEHPNYWRFVSELIRNGS